MAEAFLKVILDNLSSLIKDEIGSIMGANQEMKKLTSILTTIQVVLEDAEYKQLESPPIRNWLIKLNDLIYEIDDILDESATHVSRSKHARIISRHFNLKKILFRHKIGKRMKRVTKRLDAVAAEREKFHLREMGLERPSKIDVARETGSLLNEIVYGRDDEKEVIVNVLMNQAKENQQLSVLPVVGLGGLGKTTLAQLVHNDPRVADHFHIKLWVCVSDEFDLKTLLRATIESATGKGTASELVYLDALERRLWSVLGGKRYLLVLDDVWNDDQEKWSKLRNVLACGSAGSSIVVTTRMRKVAEIMGTLPSYNLKGLTKDDCWLLLKQRAFKQDEDDQYPSLVTIGKQIVKKCGGVPLAAKALGGLLRFKRTEKEWMNVKESDMWDLQESDAALILSALRLSYHHLPLALRQCFAYCSVFPKGSKIEKEKLIYLWMAHGYISSNGALEVEDVGEEIWNELILRSLFQIVGSFVTMHDLVHDLAQSIMENKMFGTHVERGSTSASNDKIHEVNLGKSYVAFPKSLQVNMDISSILTNYNRLRALDASKVKLQELPSKVRNLKHLRHLNLSHNGFLLSLPDALCSIWNLQTLNLYGCVKLVTLPKNLRYLKNLCHILLEGCDSLKATPPRIRELTYLKSLGVFIVDRNSGCQLEELQCLNLGGYLSIEHLERVEEDHIDARKANLGEKLNLRRLRLRWDIVSELRREIDEKVLEGLQPPRNLENLSIFRFSGRHFPPWMNKSSIENLTRVEIFHCPNLLDLAELLHLETLVLSSLYAIKHIVQDANAADVNFPSLKVLTLNSLPNLRSFFKEERMNICMNLQRLYVSMCPLLVLEQISQSKKLEECWCDNSLSLTSFPNLDIVERLTVEIGEHMTCIPSKSLERLTGLNTLRIKEAHEHCFPAEGLRRLNALQKLIIWDSDTLTCLPEGWLRHTTIEELSIFRCKEFVELHEEIQYVVTSLKRISFNSLPKMVFIPKAIRHLSFLKELVLYDLLELASLPDWLGDLTSLDSLIIFKCPKLASLPGSIQGMMNLQFLQITGCPNLERRCEGETGEDWHKIAHIPRLFIGRND